MKQSPILMLAAACLWSLNPVPADADRHCAPVLEYYYLSRFAVQQRGVPCEEAVQHGIENLSEAADQAEVCGCMSLQSSLQDIIRKANASGRSCFDQQTAILALAKDISKQVSACQ